MDITKNAGSPGPAATVGKGTVAGLMLALFVAALDATVVATAMPTIARTLDGAAHYAWPLTAYMVSSAVSTLLCGGLAYAFGLKRVYGLGLALFAAASALCAVAPSVEVLAAARLVQGLGGGVLEAGAFVAAAVMLRPRDRGPYLGAASAMYGIASVVGPVLGGAIAQGFTWQVVFLANLPIVAVAFVLAGRFLPGRAPSAGGMRFDVPGALASAGCVLCLMLAFSLAGDVFELASLPFALLTGICIALGAVVVRVERRAAAPIVPVALFARRRVLAGFAAGFCTQFALMVGIVYLPRLLQEGLGVSAALCGAVLVPMTLALVAGSNAAGALLRGTGRLRAVALASFAAVLAVAVAFALAGPAWSAAQVACAAAALGLGVGIGMPVSNLAAQVGAGERDAGRATSLALFFRGLGGTVACAACGALARAVTPAGTAAVFATAAIVAALGVVAAACVVKRLPA